MGLPAAEERRQLVAEAGVGGEGAGRPVHLKGGAKAGGRGNEQRVEGLPQPVTRWLSLFVLAAAALVGGAPDVWAIPAVEAHESAPPAETDPPTTEAEAETEADTPRPLAVGPAVATSTPAPGTGEDLGTARGVPPTPPPER